MPLICETQNGQGPWREFNQLIPGDRAASISHWNALGLRQVYLLVCEPDDSLSTLFCSRFGIDTELPGSLREVSSAGYEMVRQIKDGEMYERQFLTDRSLVPRRLRFRHLTIRFGQRRCLLCGADQPANLFGGHVSEHSEEELLQWPGGIPGLLKYYRRSVRASIAQAQGFPRVQERLRLSLEVIQEIQMRLNPDLN